MACPNRLFGVAERRCIEGEAVSHPGQDLDLVAPAGLEDEQVTGQGIALQDRPYHAGERVDPLAPVHGLHGDQTGDGLGSGAQRQPHHDPRTEYDLGHRFSDDVGGDECR
jgi:hypothetical protein